MTPLSDWLDIMLEEIERKKSESTAAVTERDQRDQSMYPRNSSGSAPVSAGGSTEAGNGAE